jgi:benzoyl-CoA reductase subunit C
MNVEQRIEWCKQQIEDPSLPLLREYKQRDGSRSLIVGNFPVWAPQEIAHAAGALPVTISGGGQLEIDHADSRVQSFVCSISRSTLELGLRGYLAALDVMVFTSICDVARNLGGMFKRNFPGIETVYLHCPQNISSPAAVDYFTAELERFRHAMEGYIGGGISDAAIAQSVNVFNEHRSVLRELYELRRAQPERVSAVESYLLLRVGQLLPREEHTAMMRSVLAELRSRPVRKRDRIRVLVEGAFCEQPPWELVQAIEDAGCYIIDDDFMLGARWFTEPVVLGEDPIRSLAEHYVNHAVMSSVRHYGSHPRTEHFAGKIGDTRADGVIFCAPKFCEPALYDYVLLKEVAEARRVPYLAFEYEEKMSTFEALRTQVETFVESILLFEN